MTTLDTIHKDLESQVHEGDIIFISIDSFLYRQVAKGTGSWTSHVGFIVKENNQWFVLESAVPKVRRTPLRDFVKRTTNNEVSVLRLQNKLTTDQIEQLKNTAEKRMGRFYHLGFKFNSERQFCSKFVYLTYKEALGIEIGKVQTLAALLEENPQASVNFWRCWYFGFVPWNRKTITPASQLVDPQLFTVYSTVS
ncbi:YiiX/YebB-like N1pC/P60 family cysteine hydrolase [Neptuniibacter caesariensis]|uniref:YebB family permuted papain-like enzyme n=1 Tax=Neptuniibacter caesariensis TaxID=207954 RepID=A0A7U8C324_NEPCE|nr:YiiX/YebB-like N1pC/P60 family cysteine hydrolase [Neptuniibacter caesariensis]EAR59544.1 hypothetical protein MED92_12214 [Oceanospirillum sp. MED92] [Neptuniibacter caesariensis]